MSAERVKKTGHFEHVARDMLTPSWSPPRLPPVVDLDTVPVLKALATANRALAEHGFVEKHSAGKSNYYVNIGLVALFVEAGAST